MSNNSRLHNLLTLNIETRGKIVSLTNSKGEGTTNYAYLFANKLGSISKGSESISFEYDGTLLPKVPKQECYTYTLTRDINNAYTTQVTDGTLTQNRTYNGYGEINQISDNVFSYELSQRDNAGAITQKIETLNGVDRTYDYTFYNYGTLGELKKVITPTKTISYQQNANNQRVTKLINGQIVEKYLWANLTTLLAVYDKDNNLVQRFEYSDNRMPISMTQNGQKYYLHYDQVGTLKAVSDSSLNVLKEISYDAYGNILSETNEAFKIPFSFAGGLYDSDTKLTRFGYRDYDIYTGKWTAKDPIGFAGGDSNLYGYVIQDPVSFTDSVGTSRSRATRGNWQLNMQVNHLLNQIYTREPKFSYLRSPGAQNQREVDFLSAHLKSLERGSNCFPTNFSPFGAGRSGAFNAAKLLNGIGRNEQPTSVRPSIDLRGLNIPGRTYTFRQGSERINILEHAGGHYYGPNNTQNRGPHFNDPLGRHFDY